MKSKTSCFNKTIFLKNITHFWPIWVMITLWNLFIMPFMIYNHSQRYKFITNLSEKEIMQDRLNDIMNIVDIYVNPIILFLFAVVAVMAVFSYLYHARSANMMHALPVTRKELFFTNYVSGLLFLIVPQIIGFLSGILVGAVCGYTSMNVMLTGLLFACGISFVFYSITVWVAMFTGQLLAVPVFAVILNFLYVGCKVLVRMLMSLISYGIPMEYVSGRLDVLSPLYYIANHVHLTYDYSGKYPVCTGLSGQKTVAVYALAAVVFVLAAYLIYRMRNLETAGSLISIPWIAPVFRWGAAFCGGSLLSVIFCSIMDFSSGKMIFVSALIGAIVFGAACFFVAQMFLEKGFRVFQKKRMLECGIFIAIFACMYIAIEFDLLGQERKLPDASDVEMACLDHVSTYGGSDEEMVEDILKLHSQIIDSKKEFEAYAADAYGNTSYLTIRYRLKDGSSLERAYKVPWEREMMNEPESVVCKVVDLATSPESYRKELFGVYDQEMKVTNCQIDLYDAQNEARDHVFSDEDADKIYQAILADLWEGNFKNCLLNGLFYDGEENGTYYNSVLLDVVGEKEVIPVYEYYHHLAPEGSKSTTANIGFDANCRNLIEALIETGAIQSEQDLVTISEWNQQNMDTEKAR